MLLGLPPSPVPDLLGEQVHVTGWQHAKRTWEGPMFFLSTNLIFLDKKKRKVYSASIACALYLPCSWRGRKGAWFQRRNGVTEKAGSWTPTHPTADAVLLQQEARTQVCCKAPLASLPLCSQLSIMVYVSTWKITSPFTAELWMKWRQVSEVFIFSFQEFTAGRREGTCATSFVASKWFNYTFSSYWRKHDKGLIGCNLKAVQMDLAEPLKFSFWFMRSEDWAFPTVS